MPQARPPQSFHFCMALSGDGEGRRQEGGEREEGEKKGGEKEGGGRAVERGTEGGELKVRDRGQQFSYLCTLRTPLWQCRS